MFDITSFGVGVAIFLDILMIVYTVWVISLTSEQNKLSAGIGIGLLGWLGLLHLGLTYFQKIFQG